MILSRIKMNMDRGSTLSVKDFNFTTKEQVRNEKYKLKIFGNGEYPLMDYKCIK